ncbi:hypothetical protein MUK42_21916 [Musa troglodytarum]|uniref:Uncharacterized protein n=1 Tax=Musa troglodytarum TaxID=320322 RepID=A0A9E7JJ50_9LILI|nr:hypothetical protein MUK42_21916 [Musa troglodytarum]
MLMAGGPERGVHLECHTNHLKTAEVVRHVADIISLHRGSNQSTSIGLVGWHPAAAIGTRRLVGLQHGWSSLSPIHSTHGHVGMGGPSPSRGPPPNQGGAPTGCPTANHDVDSMDDHHEHKRLVMLTHALAGRREVHPLTTRVDNLN